MFFHLNRREINPSVRFEKIYSVIDETPVIGEIEKEFYKKLIEIRYQQVLLPAGECLLAG